MLVDMDTSFGECVNQKQVSVIHEMENRVHILRQPKEIALVHTALYCNWHPNFSNAEALIRLRGWGIGFYDLIIAKDFRNRRHSIRIDAIGDFDVVHSIQQPILIDKHS